MGGEVSLRHSPQYSGQILDIPVKGITHRCDLNKELTDLVLSFLDVGYPVAEMTLVHFLCQLSDVYHRGEYPALDYLKAYDHRCGSDDKSGGNSDAYHDQHLLVQHIVNDVGLIPAKICAHDTAAAIGHRLVADHIIAAAYRSPADVCLAVLKHLRCDICRHLGAFKTIPVVADDSGRVSYVILEYGEVTAGFLAYRVKIIVSAQVVADNECPGTVQLGGVAVIDSISISPQECYTLDILYGAGSFNGMIGDAIFHCHLYPHFHEGMWTLWRVFDRLQDGNGTYPDGTRIEPLMPLRDRPLPPARDALHPGYPGFVAGTFGEEPLQPPLGIITETGKIERTSTPTEKANFVDNFAPGALSTDTCPCCTDADIKVFEIAAVQAKLTYNKYGWHDPQGRFFVLKEDIEKAGSLDEYIRRVEWGEIRPEPLVIRVNAGDCIEIRLTNLLPEYIGGNDFQLKTLTGIVGYHIHLVKFDTIVADGAANGWNNIAGARRYETLVERFFANEELNTVFFHNHLFANMHQQHRMFGALIVEPAGSVFLDPETGEELKCGTKAVIRTADGKSFREFALFLHDFALLYDRHGKPLNPPEHPGSDDDPGVMGINYRCEPMPERLKIKNDPAHIFSSFEYGDPCTPILETYPGEPLRIRLLDGAHEEQHVFNIEGMPWRKEITDVTSPLVQSQTIGISEAFNLHIDQPYPAGDYLYYSGGIDDLWLGLWGIIRAYATPQEKLLPLCGFRPVCPPLTPPPGAAVRRFEVAAIQTDIKYNRFGDHDPEGLIFVPLEQARDVMSGRKEPVPLILRANAGDWIEVTLHNLFDPNKPIIYHDYPSVPLDLPHNPGNCVSLCPQFLKYDPVTSSGVNVGYNPVEQTAAPWKSRKYLWRADREYGTALLCSFGDLRIHRHHGLFGAMIIEPAGAEYYNGIRPTKENHNECAVITAPGEEAFREFVLLAHNGIRLLDKDGVLIKTTEQDMEEGEPGGHEAPDHEDTGEKGYNYRSERFFNRLKRIPLISKVFDSKTHGDPATPLFCSYVGERVRIRLLMPADKPRNISFVLHGHRWKAQPGDPLSRDIPVQGAMSVGNVLNIEPERTKSRGDYLYRSGSLRWDVESGMWGDIPRNEPQYPLPLRKRLPPHEAVVGEKAPRSVTL